MTSTPEMGEPINNSDVITKIREILRIKKSYMYPQYYQEITEIIGDGNGNRQTIRGE